MSNTLRALRQLPLANNLNAIFSDDATIKHIVASVTASEGFLTGLTAAQKNEAIPEFLVAELDDASLLRLNEKVKGYWDGLATITVDEAPEGLIVRYHFERDFEGPLFALLNKPDVASRLAELWLTGEDEGANGTRQFALEKLLAGDRVFPALRAVHFERTQPEHSNRTIVTLGYGHEEAGALGILLERAPDLRRLDAPSAPSKRFFDRRSHPLEEFRFAVGYAHEGCVKNLAASKAFSSLRTLEISDYAEKYVPGWEANRVPREDWLALFDASGLPALRHLTLVGTVLEASECDALLATPLGRQLEKLTIRE